MHRVLGSFVVVAAAASAAMGCSTSTTDTTTLVTGPPAIAVSASGCADPTRVARLTVTGRIYAPVVVTATIAGNDVTTFLATTAHVDVPLPASTPTETDVTVTVLARNDDGTPMLDVSGKQAASAITARLTEPNASACVTSPM
jgi:hypothetical protein